MANGKDNNKAVSGQLLEFVPDSYLDRTSRPVYALVYLLGFIVFYEFGTIMMNPAILDKTLSQWHVRVVSFVWIQNILEYLGFSHRMTWIAAPAAVIIILLVLQITSKSSWYVNLFDFIPMTLECIVLAVPLLVLSLLVNAYPIGQAAGGFLAEISAQAGEGGFLLSPLMSQIITGIGAGIYEELIFRLILISIIMIVLQDFIGLGKGSSLFIAIVVSAFLFSIHHHFFFVDGEFTTSKHDPFTVATFTFRFLAGIYFAAVFAFRGFAIVASSHAFYDIIAALLNTFAFNPPNS
ncbi:CAAX amino terminal protease self- immunity [Anaerohalosphaera lusitana]|uniref:CAAX amino terminal protease self-immunity n=1 Tax=Anaerohalosphaera lusitana TaxID=1936003 RepID=A0A1U9NHZ5_9BACT|nr:CPBP family intramembrane glutamic endopeptidase [Anaerohalosphaera lusitana]AQT67549.1 CAAX amino terminal protease self- immunity [Anaerohalosphaera lusitana]